MSEVRLIDGNTLRELVTDMAGKAGTKGAYAAVWKCARLIDNAPTITPESLGWRKEVVGRWERVEDTEADWRCSACKSEVCLADNAVTPKGAELYFCPNCGAKMEGEP